MNTEWEHLDRCPVCNGEYGEYFAETFDHELDTPICAYRCPQCYCLYHNPRLTQNSMAEYYSSGLYRTHPSRSSPPKGNARNSANMKVKLIQAFMQDVKASIHRCLDYGCGKGILVNEIKKELGCETIGFDLYRDPKAEIDIINDKDQIPGKFDLITCVHVLEHLPYPITELDWMASRLNEDGILLIEIPFTQIIFPPHPILFARETVPLLMKHLKARYMYYDMQYFNNNGIIIAQPNHPTEYFESIGAIENYGQEE